MTTKKGKNNIISVFLFVLKDSPLKRINIPKCNVLLLFFYCTKENVNRTKAVLWH